MSDSDDEVRFRRRTFAELSVEDLYEILRLRGDVFVVEQGVSEENDLDGRDPECVHVTGRDARGRLVASARMLPVASPVVVSRIVVRREDRGRGIGTALLAYVDDCLGPCAATMSAQARLEDWYGRRGWTREGDLYDEVGIPHLRLARPGREADEPR